MESDLVGLRAELHKKRVEASKYGAGQRGLPKREGVKSNRSTSFNLKNAGVVARDARDKQQKEDETPSAEAARSIMEKKAKLYEKLHGGIETLEDDTLNQKYLVNFQRKIVDEVTEKKKIREREEEDRKAEQREREESQPENYSTSKTEEEWVEYTDVLGRTRECMKKDLPTMVEQDKNLLGEDQDDDAIEAELISGEKYREKLREKWELEEEINAFKKDMHYQDVSYNEARMHGTGYMKFSQDEKERKAQMDMLKELHNEAVRAEQTKKIATSKSQKLLQARLEKVRQRKRLKLGLPMKDDDKLKTPPTSDDEEEVIGPPLPSKDTILENTSEETDSKLKKPKMREWDVGKQMGGASPLSQEEWIDRQRTQRNEEFAPPSVYTDNKRQKTQNRASSSYQESTTSEPSYKEDERRNEFAPPSTFEYYGPSSFSSRRNRGRANYKSMENAIDKGLSHLRNLNNQ